MKPGEMQGMIQKPQSHDANFSPGLMASCLNHPLPGWGAASLDHGLLASELIRGFADPVLKL
jgi:hypothetical protein